MPTTKASSVSRGAPAGIEVTTLSRSRAARASVAPARRRSIGRCSPTPTRNTVWTAPWRLSGTETISPTAPVARWDSSTASRSIPTLSPSTSASGGSSSASVPGWTAYATAATPCMAEGGSALSANSGGLT